MDPQPVNSNHSASFLWEAYDSYVDIMHTRADPRTERLPLVKSPIPMLVIMAVYLFLCWRGPKWMQHRKAWELRGFMIFYNFALVALSAYMVAEFLLSAWLFRYSLVGCEPVDWRDTPENWRVYNNTSRKVIQVTYLYWVSKLIELADTIVFILRKKNNQITALHVIHHTIMPLGWYLGLKYAAGGMSTFHALINSFIHVVMYSYYGLAAIGPHMQKYLTWKKYMTKMQITQFIIVFAHISQLNFIECDYPPLFRYIINAYSIIFFVLFSNFYIQTYLKNRRAAGAAKQVQEDIHQTKNKLNSNGINSNGSNSYANDGSSNGKNKKHK